ncbi:nuclear transport factor 2 family protein [Novosphingobium sp. BL-8H]|uniref:nuclear transport factor 2 family protein n=1 Tax=Novosphingobium sp. BL-8H TaxID=3127640 RepID=UPI003757D182
MESDAILHELADKDAIRDLIHRYCRAVDRIDVPLGHSIWHDDGHADYGADFYQGPGKGVIDRICADHARLLSHSHQVANVLVAIDGDRAGSEAYVNGTMRARRGEDVLHIAVWGRYCDRWERRAGRWGLVHRTVVFDHEEMRVVTPMEHRNQGARDRSDPSYAALLREDLR